MVENIKRITTQLPTISKVGGDFKSASVNEKLGKRKVFYSKWTISKKINVSINVQLYLVSYNFSIIYFFFCTFT